MNTVSVSPTVLASAQTATPLVAIALILSLGCSDARQGTHGDETEGGGGFGGGVSSASGGGESTGGGSCNDLLLNGPSVPDSADPASAPTPTGGLIEDGTYFLYEYVHYQATSANDDMNQSTLRVDGETWDYAWKESGKDEKRGTAIVGTDAGSLYEDTRCGSTMLGAFYSASPTELMLFLADDQGTIFTGKRYVIQ